MRDIAATYIERNKDFFLPFLPCMNGEDGMGAERSGLMSENDFQSYCQNVRSSSLWGGQPEITALSNAYNVPIRVIQWGDPVQFITDPGNSPGLIDEKRVVNISYHRRMYGLGEVSVHALHMHTEVPAHGVTITALQFFEAEVD